MQKLVAVSLLSVAHWWAILLSLAMTTVGWVAQLCTWGPADTLIMVGTAWVMVSVMLALRRIARQGGLPIVCPLCLLSVGLLLLVLEPLCRPVASPATALLRPLGEIVAALGVVRLLLNLNSILASKSAVPNRPAHIRQP